MAGINLFDMLTQANNGAAVQQVGQQAGLQPDMAQAAIKALLPAIAGGLQRNVQQPGGLQSLLGALQNGQHAQYLDQPDSLAQPNAIADGNAILGHLLGSKDTSRAVAAQAAKKTGLSEQVMKSMLPMVASMAMASLSKQTKQPDMASALSGMLSGKQPQAAQAGIGGLLGGLLGGKKQSSGGAGAMGMLGGLLDADGDGNPMDDIFQIVMTRR